MGAAAPLCMERGPRDAHSVAMVCVSCAWHSNCGLPFRLSLHARVIVLGVQQVPTETAAGTAPMLLPDRAQPTIATPTPRQLGLFGVTEAVVAAPQGTGGSKAAKRRRAKAKKRETAAAAAAPPPLAPVPSPLPPAAAPREAPRTNQPAKRAAGAEHCTSQLFASRHGQWSL